jgi:hypothetical protein
MKLISRLFTYLQVKYKELIIYIIFYITNTSYTQFDPLTSERIQFLVVLFVTHVIEKRFKVLRWSPLFHIYNKQRHNVN